MVPIFPDVGRLPVVPVAVWVPLVPWSERRALAPEPPFALLDEPLLGRAYVGPLELPSRPRDGAELLPLLPLDEGELRV